MITIKIKGQLIPRKYVAQRMSGTIHILSWYIPFGAWNEIKMAILPYNNAKAVRYAKNLFLELFDHDKKRVTHTYGNLEHVVWRKV